MNLKPRSSKAPLWLLPARALRVIAGAMENGARKYAPWNWTSDHEGDRELYTSALLRHATALADPTEPDYDEDGIHHAASIGACAVILIWKLGIDYVAPKEKTDAA